MTVTDVSASAGVAFPAPVQRTAPPAPARVAPAGEKVRVSAARPVDPVGADPTPPLPVAAERAALDAGPRHRSGEAEEAQSAYALTITDALWQLTKSFQRTV